MLVLAKMWCQDDVRTKSPDLQCHRQGIPRIVVNVAIASQFQKPDGRPDYAGGLSRLQGAFLRRSRTGSLAFRRHQNVNLVTVQHFMDEHSRTAELDVVGVSADGQDSHI